MSLLLPALGVGALWYGGATLYQMKSDAVKKSQVPEDEEEGPYWGPVGHIKDRFWADTRGRFVKVREDVDEKGAQIFWVDYGNGQEVLQFVDPRILL